MQKINIDQGAWQEVIAPATIHQTFAVTGGIALVMFGTTGAENPALRLGSGDAPIVVPSGIPLFARAETGICNAVIGDFGTLGFTPAPEPLPPTEAIVANGSTLTVLPATGTAPAQGTIAATVAANALTLRLAANRVVLTSGVAIPVQNSAGAAIGSGTLTVSANAAQHVRLPATVAGVTNGQVLAVDGGTVTLAVAGGVVSATFTPTP